MYTEHSILDELVKKAKTKALQHADEQLLREQIELIFKQEPKLKKELESRKDKLEKSAAFKIVVKKIKQALHRDYGSYQTDVSKRKSLLLKIKENPHSLELHAKLLQTHKSTKERLPLYETLYDTIFSITGKPKEILDIGCGLNPCSLPWMHLDAVTYIASEFNEADMQFIREYFAVVQKKGQHLLTETIDLHKDSSALQKHAVDVVFAWKLLDLLNSTEIENIFSQVLANYIVISFSTKTLGNREMNSPQRKWFLQVLEKKGLQYETLEYDNELFYVIHLNKKKSK